MKIDEIINMVKPAEEQLVLQRNYFRVILLIHDIDSNGKLFSNASKLKNDSECFRLLKASFISYSVLYASLKSLSIYSQNDESLKDLVKGLKPKLEFMNHLRNKISGHLEDQVIDHAIQWQPTLFSKGVFEEDKLHLTVSYYGLLESAVNSYLDEDGKQKYFGHEIDVCYTPDWKEFLKFMSETSSECLDYLERIKSTIVPQLELIETREELLKQAIWAGQTDFKVEGRRR